MTIGFIGLGIMGRPMARNLLKAGHSLVVTDLNRAAVDELVRAGAREAATARDVAALCPLVITMLPNSPHVKAAVLGENGVAQGAAPGTTLIDMSSISPAASQEIASALEKRGVDMLDAPVSGGEPKAVDGTLAIMVGGKQEVFDRCRNVLGAMGSSVSLCGAIGSGNITKLANQIIVALNIAALSEAFVLGTKAGVDPELIFSAVKGGLAGSAVMNAKAPMMMARDFKPGFKIDLHYKDIANALDTARELDVPLPLTAQVFEMLKCLRNDGKGQNDHSGILEFYEGLAKITVKKDP